MDNNNFRVIGTHTIRHKSRFQHVTQKAPWYNSSIREFVQICHSYVSYLFLIVDSGNKNKKMFCFISCKGLFLKRVHFMKIEFNSILQLLHFFLVNFKPIDKQITLRKVSSPFSAVFSVLLCLTPNDFTRKGTRVEKG